MTISHRPVIILGAGGHAKVVANVLKISGRDVIGLVTPDEEEGTLKFGLKVLGKDNVLNSYSKKDILLANGVGALPKEMLRWELSKEFRDKGYTFINVIHPSAIIAEDVELGGGVQVMAGSVIQPGSYIGRDTIVNTASQIDHDCYISNNCHLSPGVILSGGVKIGKGCHIGTGSIVIQNISIGSNTVIAAGSVVYKHIADGMCLIQSKQNNIEK
jgi:sugar O-acyltransferase (sialic acid O-acetyltransferase NeuD family)